MSPPDPAPPSAARADAVALAAAFARRAGIPRASLPADFDEGPWQPLRPAWERRFAALAVEAPPSFLTLLDCEPEVVIDFPRCTARRVAEVVDPSRRAGMLAPHGSEGRHLARVGGGRR